MPSTWFVEGNFMCSGDFVMLPRIADSAGGGLGDRNDVIEMCSLPFLLSSLSSFLPSSLPSAFSLLEFLFHCAAAHILADAAIPRPFTRYSISVLCCPTSGLT